MHISENKQQVVGALVFVGLLSVIGITYMSGQKSANQAEDGTYRVQATFNRIDGLQIGDHVMLGGVPIGRVLAHQLDDNFRAKVTLQLDQNMPLPLDTSASIQTDGLFGSKHIALEPGGEIDLLKNGGRIDYTQDAVVVSDLLDLIISQGRARLADSAAQTEAKE